MRQSNRPRAGASRSRSIDVLAVPIALLDAEGRITAVNRALSRLAPGARAGRSLSEALAAAAEETAKDDFGQTYGFGAHSERRWRRLNLEPDGEAQVAVLTDVTGARAALEEVRPARAARDELLHDATIGTWRFDPDSQVYNFSAELLAPFGGAQPGVPKAQLDSITHPDDLPIEAAVRERITREGGAGEIEIRVRGSTGEWQHIRILMRAGRRLPSGRVEMYGLTQLVTELAQARDEAKAIAQRLDLALKASRAGVFEYDYKRRAFWLSSEFSDLIGEEALSKTAVDPFAMFNPDDRPAILALRDRAARSSGADPADVRLVRSDGERWVRLYLEVEVVGGRPSRGVGLMIDIDEAKRQEIAISEARNVAEAATRSKSDFLASVSHEIRTPMNGIVGVLNLLKGEGLSDGGRQLLGEALGCADMLSQLINDVLDFSKIEAGRLELSPVPTDPVAVTESVVSLVRPQAEAKGLTLAARCEAGVGLARIDPVRVRQCLFNIVGNAVKFTDRGGVEVRLATCGEGEARRLRFEVEDSGIGVPEDARSRLFDRFQQVEGGSTRRFGGTGLGLAISRQLARMMGGELDYWSREGEGSTFWFEIAAPPAAAPADRPTDAMGEAPLAGVKVLVVDDNRVNRLVGVKTLAVLGADAEAVESGAAAVEAVGGGAYDLVLMDINMPGMDGLEATRRIRGLGPAGAGVPIIALTADVMRHHHETYLAAGMNGVVAKPFSPTLLLAELGRLAQAPTAETDAA